MNQKIIILSHETILILIGKSRVDATLFGSIKRVQSDYKIHMFAKKSCFPAPSYHLTIIIHLFLRQRKAGRQASDV